MPIRRLWLVVAALLIPTAAGAHDHTADFFAAFCLAGGSTLKGFQESLAVTLPRPASHDLSLLGDFSVHKGSHEGSDSRRITVMGGPRWIVPGAPGRYPVRVSGHALGGVVRSGLAGREDSDVAFAFGGSVDFYPMGERTPGLTLRLQTDYVTVVGADNFWRASVGGALRLKKQ